VQLLGKLNWPCAPGSYLKIVGQPRFSAESTVLLATVDTVARSEGKEHIFKPGEVSGSLPVPMGRTVSMNSKGADTVARSDGKEHLYEVEKH
jgi:hypothetical protein